VPDVPPELLPLLDDEDDDPAGGWVTSVFRVAVGNGVSVGGSGVSVGDNAACTVISTIAVCTASVLITLMSGVGSCGSPVPHAETSSTAISAATKTIFLDFFAYFLHSGSAQH